MNKKAIVSLLVLALVAVACATDSGTEEAAVEVVEEPTTLETVQARGFLKCGVSGSAVAFSETQAVDHATRRLNPDFVLNDSRFTGASILLARDNFGCGSSREHAPWAILEYGFKAVIAPSYADIFFNNSFKNGLLPVILAESEVDTLFALASGETPIEITVDLQSQTVTGPNGFSASFEIDPFRKTCLLEGLDEIGLSLKDADAIKAYEAKRAVDAPWLFRD